GIAESLIKSFSQFPKLRVAQQQKSFRYKGAEVDLQHAARELNVQAILSGKLVLRGDTLVVKISASDSSLTEGRCRFYPGRVWGRCRQFSARGCLRERADIPNGADSRPQIPKTSFGSNPNGRD